MTTVTYSLDPKRPLQEKMRSDRRGYFSDDAVRACYRELIAMRERNRGR